MKHALHQLFVHLVWTTWDRAAILDDDVQAWLWPALAERARSLGSNFVVVGGIADHVHVLVELPATMSVADLVKNLKGATSREGARRNGDNTLRWQGGYGAFTVGRADLDTVAAYVNNQKQHHANLSVIAAWERSRDQP